MSNVPTVLAMSGIKSVESIDSGNTVLIRFERPDGSVVVVLFPKTLAPILVNKLGALNEPGFAAGHDGAGAVA